MLGTRAAFEPKGANRLGKPLLRAENNIDSDECRRMREAAKEAGAGGNN